MARPGDRAHQGNVKKHVQNDAVSEKIDTIIEHQTDRISRFNINNRKNRGLAGHANKVLNPFPSKI